jgi:hypothetical protein
MKMCEYISRGLEDYILVGAVEISEWWGVTFANIISIEENIVHYDKGQEYECL